jgi:hypothetical protein
MAQPSSLRRASGACTARPRAAVGAAALLVLIHATCALGAAVPAEVQAARAGHEPVRRKLINLQTPAASYFHQPLVNCFNYSILQPPASVSPACCALTAAECAARCDATPGCLAFKYAWRVPLPRAGTACTSQLLPAPSSDGAAHVAAHPATRTPRAGT